MKLIYITACLPFGPAETFVIGEIAELLNRNEVLVIPRSPGGVGQHAQWLVPYALRESLLSWRVLAEALGTCLVHPLRAASILRVLLHSNNLKTTLRNLAVFPKGLWLARVAGQWGADHIHCHWAGTTATMTMVAAHISGIPWSLTAHRSDIVSDNLLQEKVRSATKVRLIAAEGRKMMIARGVESSEKLTVLPMGVPIPSNGHIRRHGDHVVLCPADLLAVKGHRFLIDAWSILRERGLRAKLWLAGSGRLESQLRAQVAALDLNESITFLGTVNHEVLLDFYRHGAISAVVLASVNLGGGVHEGLPVALVEAMSFGVPVITTNTGGIPELVQPGTGVLVPPEDSTALANALERVLQDESFASSIGLQGFLQVVKTRNIVHIAAELESIFTASGRPVSTLTVV